MADFPQRPPFFHFFFKEHVLNPVHQNKNYVFNELDITWEKIFVPMK